MKSFLASILFVSQVVVFSQNLIPNSNFEEYKSCPDGLRQFDRVKDWYSASAGTPEYFQCEFSGRVNPVTGKGQVAIIPFAAYYSDLEYIAVELLDSLIEKEIYCFEFYLQPDKDSPVLINKIGAFFSSEKIRVGYWNLNNIKPQIVLENIAPVGEWTRVSGQFIAQGGEKYVTIGNFFAKEKLKKINHSRRTSEGWYSYYFLDEFSLRKRSCNVDFQETQSDFIDKERVRQTHIVYFETNQSNIIENEAQRLAIFLKDIPLDLKTQVELIGHTDSDSGDLFNEDLSYKRVIKVEQFIGDIYEFSFIKSWKGETEPLNSNHTEELKSLNRRVEINVIY